MIQTIFETKQRAGELMQKAIEIWHGSDHSDYLEGIERDPVFSLLMTALAYRANETETEIVQMKQDLLEEFASMQTPYEIGHAIPATAVVETALQDEFSEVELTPDHIFTLGYDGVPFMPLLLTRVLNASVSAVTRLDGRRWKVKIDFKSPVSDLAGFTFAVLNQNYSELRLSLDGNPVALVDPWDYAELPLSPCFSVDTALYNKSQTYMASSLPLDLYARQHVRMYTVKRYQAQKLIPYETESITLVFEFMGITDKFTFSENSLALNTLILVNAQRQNVTLSKETPVVRLTGGGDTGGDGRANNPNQQFLHLLRPSDDQVYRNTPVEVRRMAADRFNQGQLLKSLNHMLGKYYSDYYAFINISGVASDKVMNDLTRILKRLADAAKGAGDKGKGQATTAATGVYLMLRPSQEQRRQPLSLDLSYMTTLGAAVNDALTADAVFTPPSGFVAKATRQIAQPVPGFDELRDERDLNSLSRYYAVTNNRLVTPADIRLFCHYELATHYGVTHDMVKSLSVKSRQQFDFRQCGYEILVDIVVADNSFVRRGFAGKKDAVAMLLQSMISVRSTNIYPVKVSIHIDQQ